MLVGICAKPEFKWELHNNRCIYISIGISNMTLCGVHIFKMFGAGGLKHPKNK
jgi:hypothetical protein